MMSNTLNNFNSEKRFKAADYSNNNLNNNNNFINICLHLVCQTEEKMRGGKHMKFKKIFNYG